MCHTEMCDIMEMEKIVLIHDSLMRKEVDAFPMDEYFEVFMRENYRKFVAYCISRGEDSADADEIVGEAFVRLHTKWNERCSFDKDQNKKWMYNTIEYIRKEYKKNSRKTEADDIDEHSEYLADGTEIDENLRYEELLKTIGQGLGESDRELFQLVYVEEKSYSEICEKLKIESQPLRTRISRLKARIKKILKK